jgi:lipopolysaccharide/colanic/teichoic acid biosynthesis glycosyltransferase
MVTGADSVGPPLTRAGDPRVTRVGRLLRATKIDELPQLWNVVRGDMSLVGPRPEAPRYVQRYSDIQRRVLTIKPGITGPAQITYRDEERLIPSTNPEEYYCSEILPRKLQLDLEYVAHHSVHGDIALLWATIVRLFRAREVVSKT